MWEFDRDPILTLSSQILLMDSERVPGANVELVEKRLFAAIDKVRTMRLFRDLPVL